MRLQTVAAAVAALVLSLGSTDDSRAMDVSPMVAKITPSGSGSSYRLTVRNDSAAAATVEIEVYRMQVDETGARSLTPEDDDIVVFPVQSVIPPNREQVVQVSGSYNSALLRAAQGMTREGVELVEGAIRGIPLYDGDGEQEEGAHGVARRSCFVFPPAERTEIA